MNPRRSARRSLLISALLPCLLISGCWFKKKQPQVAQAPTITSPQATTSPSPSQKQTNGAKSTQQAAAASSSQNKTQTAQAQAKPKPKPPVKRTKPPAPKNGTSEAASNKAATPATGSASNPTIAQNVPPIPKITIEPTVPDTGGAISATAPHSDDAHNKLTTAQLLQSTDDNLKSIKRALTTDEQAQLVQIKNFMAQARSAATDSDLVRAHNLALKAHLLSDELVRRR